MGAGFWHVTGRVRIRDETNAVARVPMVMSACYWLK